MPEYVRKIGGVAHSIFATLSDLNGPIDIPVGSTVQFVTSDDATGEEKTRRAAVVLSPGAAIGNSDRGVVRYDPVVDDLDTVGIFKQQWEVIFPTVLVPQSFPEDGYSYLLVIGNL